MSEQRAQLSALLGRVRTRWRLLVALRAWAHAAAAACLVLALALLAHRLIVPEGIALILLWSVAGVGALTCLAAVIPPIQRAPRDLQLARFIEEQCPDLDDVLVTAVGEEASGSDPVAVAVVDEALRRVRGIDRSRIVSDAALRRSGLMAGAAVSALLILAAFSAGPAGQAARLFGIYLSPDRLALSVSPGDVRIRGGDSLRVVAKVSSIGALVPVMSVSEGPEWRQTPMEAVPEGFAVAFEKVERGFRYSVSAAGTATREYTVTVVRPPHVERIDLRYEYPPAFRMPARKEEDGGDIYGPAGTRVQVTVHTDRPVARAALNLTGRQPLALELRDTVLEGELIIAEDGSYRVALTDADGLSNPGDTEYFIRTLQDRPPDVRIIRPASDRQVTPVEEVSIEASVEDDFGVAALDLVYAIGAGPEKVLPFQRDGLSTAVLGRRTVYLEDMAVRPGDVVAYYARARDVSQGKRSTEARSDMFFLEVTPFEQELVASQSQGAGGGGALGNLEDLAQRQKDIVTATWNLDRRGREAGGRSDEDIRAVDRAQRDVRAGALAALAQLRGASDLRRRPVAGQVASDAMLEATGRAAEAMARAHLQLQALNTSDALPHEMAALNELLRAQAEVRRREVQQQANGAGGRVANRQKQDFSSLFDRELARQQQTNYETSDRPETRRESSEDSDAIEKIRELTRRQDALNRRQQELAKNRANMPADQLRRELERLTREQGELRRQAEELARQLQQRAEARGRQGGDSGNQATRELQQISEDMQGAASELRRENPQEASARGNRAAERLRDLERRMRGAQPDDRRRAVGEMQLESRQLADAQRRLTDDPAAASGGDDRADRSRRLAAAQERLAERTERLEQGVRQLARTAQDADPREQSALQDAVREIGEQRPSQRMRSAARAEQQQPGAKPEGENIARVLDRLADRLGAAGGLSEDSERLTEKLARVRQLREDLTDLDEQLSELRGRAGDSTGAARGRSGQPGSGEQGSGVQEGDAREPWQTARDLLNELRNESRLESLVPEANGFDPGRSAPGTEAWKQDFARWDELKLQVGVALERAERDTADQLRDQQSRDRLNAGATQTVPEAYRRLVEKYYRALASGSDKK
ncbi:MAG: hypothetical protein HYX77_06330 [Acidobacteria bacterium]|nr:hypothetical protein [Acidobacteriota bacterium]